MKPVRLEFNGFNSFSEKAEIDFSALLQNGIFGIFGKTGSGKSTILDCIMYALFAKTSRSQNLREYVNEKGNSAYVDFTFEILDGGERKTYNVKRTLKINKRNLPDTAATLSVVEKDGLHPVDTKDVTAKIKEIIGVGYDEFSKCIILPQNEFAAFVKSQRRDRLLLVSKLFSLEKYDKFLLEAVKRRMNEEKYLLGGIDGELNQLSGYTAEALAELKAAFITQKSLFSEVSEKLSAAEEKLKSGQYYCNIFKQLEENEKRAASLDSDRQKIAAMKEKTEKSGAASEVAKAVEEYKKASLSHKNALISENKTLAEQEKIKEELSETEKILRRDFGKEIAEIAEKIGLMQANSGVADDIERLRVEYAKVKAERDGYAQDAEKASAEVAALSAELDALGNPNDQLDRLFEDAGAASALNEIREQVAYFTQKREDAKAYEGERMYFAVVDEIDARLNTLRERIPALAAAGKDGKALLVSLSEIRAAGERQNELMRRLSAKRELSAKYKEKADALSAETFRLAGEGKEKRELLVKLSASVGAEVTTKSSFTAALKKLNAERENLHSEFTSATAKKAELTARLADITSELSAIRERVSAAKEDEAAKLNEVKEKLSAGGFASAEDAASFALDERQISEYNNKIEEFEKESVAVAALAEKLSGELNGSSFDKAAYELAEKEKQSLSDERDGYRAAVLRLETKIEETEAKLAEANAVRKRRNEVAARAALLEKLEKVLSNHNLLNFIAEEYLTEISAGASVTLLTLTGGRYDLVYDGEFFVTDNISCGERRPVSTLSGGETFLVSLSLALALSQAICEKTMRPVEFFFLDEGFGTLDEDLTDVVLDSLTKLRGEHFAIGLISHVPELKQRISAKILVTGATASEGSKIEVVC